MRPRSSRAVICGCLSLLLLVHGASRPGEPLHPSEISCIYARETGNASEPCDYQDVPGALLRIGSDYPSDGALINQSHFVWPAHFLTHDLNQHEEESSYAIRNSNEILFDHFNSLHDDFILFGLSFYLFALRLGVV